MNTTLPPARDLPPGRHAEIRAAVLRAATPDRTRRWVAPLVTATAALAVIGAVAWVAPWSGGGTTQAGQPMPTTETAPTETPPTETPPPTSPQNRSPSVADLTSEEVTAIEQGCREVTFPQAEFTLLAILTDDAGRLALLRGTDDRGDEYLINCTLGFTPAMPYNGSGGGLDAFTPPLSVDTNASASAGGDSPGNKAEYAGMHGTEVYAGRISADVAKVTVTRDDQTVEAILAGDSYLARIVHPADWAIPENMRPAIVRAYDKNGTLLAESGL